MKALALFLLLALGVSQAQTTHTVRAGDTLSSLARTYHTTAGLLLTLNALTTSTLQVGQILRLPQTGYTVQPGDTLYRVARQYGMTPELLAELNGLTSSTVQVGQVLRLPEGASPVTPTPAPRVQGSTGLDRGLFTPSRLPPVQALTFRTAGTGTLRPPSVYLQDVGFAYQTRNNCGPAAIAAALRHYGVQADQTTWQGELRPGGRNMRFPDAQRLLRDLGFEAPVLTGGTVEDIKRQVAQGFPVVVLQFHSVLGQTPHFRVVRGYDDAQGILIMSDSLSGPNVALTEHDFDLLWNTQGRQYLVVRPG
ncbi:LysM peptidoglycan-binding domain-containing protein [Deinococcus apachensis]|uniref:LysM peptidoglycan-binding domain-containing protein n=1 Tax=Deinococcus apachensis TaxID=309886 RepID=UPI000360E8F5|nr:LysM peptidoglycan-binding domain-containing protein [Deinococcus apachensis]